MYPKYKDAQTRKVKDKIEKVDDQKKLAERAGQKKLVKWAEKKAGGGQRRRGRSCGDQDDRP